MNNKKRQFGFTLVEIVVVLFIMTTFLGLITLNLSSSQKRASISSMTDVLISDLKSQQVKAMVGDTEGRLTADNYGVYLDTSGYTLYHGTAYSPSDTANFTIELAPQFVFTTPGKEIRFNRFSGEVNGFSAQDNTITIQDQATGQQKTLQYNRLGVITSLN